MIHVGSECGEVDIISGCHEVWQDFRTSSQAASARVRETSLTNWRYRAGRRASLISSNEGPWRHLSFKLYSHTADGELPPVSPITINAVYQFEEVASRIPVFPRATDSGYSAIGPGTRACGSEQTRWTRLAGKVFTAQAQVCFGCLFRVPPCQRRRPCCPRTPTHRDGLRFAVPHAISRPALKRCRPNWAAGGPQSPFAAAPSCRAPAAVVVAARGYQAC